MQADYQKILIITNGDSAVSVMQEAAIPGDYLPWRDVLHNGPVPADLNWEELFEVRADFIIAQGWGKPEDIKQGFNERDAKLKSFREYEQVQLWFEHGLYDQLQILQILDWFSDQETGGVELSMNCTEQYLGMSTPDEMKSLLKYEEPVTQKQLSLAKQAWAAFRAPTPEQWSALLDQDTSALPFLSDAILRLLEEYPAVSDGLGRTARTALRIIAEGETNLWKIFEGYQETEERRFLGDSCFWMILNQMTASSPPCLIQLDGGTLNLPVHRDEVVNITQTGLDLLDGKINWHDLHRIDEWIGGVHLTPDNLWYWSKDMGRIVYNV